MNNQSNSAASSATLNQSTQSTQPSKAKKSKANKPLIATAIVCAVLAVAGIGFGVYGMLQTNSKSSEISELKVQISDKDKIISEFESDGLAIVGEDSQITITDSATTSNPIISSTDQTSFMPTYESPKYYTDGYVPDRATISLEDGAIKSCATFHDDTIVNQNCNISGLSGSIYKIVTAGEGQGVYLDEVAFIMTDGSVQYIKLSDLVDDGNATVQGTYPIDGFVVDGITANAFTKGSLYGGYSTTIFILSNGSQISYGDISK